MDEDHLSDITSSFVESLFMDNLDDECIDTTNADSEEISDFTDTYKLNDSNGGELENDMGDTNENELEAINDITAADFENQSILLISD